MLSKKFEDKTGHFLGSLIYERYLGGEEPLPNGIGSPLRQSILIIEVPDDYYLINIWDGLNNKYFKCDQIDGLLDCLNKNVKV